MASASQSGPIEDIDAILDALTNQVGRDLGPELERQIRQIMVPLSRKARAELAAVIDDCFEVTESVQEGRSKALWALSTVNLTQQRRSSSNLGEPKQ
nr:hypothetical protein [uncultured Halomonas sp.]